MHFRSTAVALFLKLFDNSDRPLIITIAGWWLIITAITVAYSLVFFSSFDQSHMFGYTEIATGWLITFNFIGGLACLAMGYGILNGQSWGRRLYFIYTPASIVAGAIAFQVEQAFLVISVLLFLIFAYLLTRKDSNNFFNGTYTRNPKNLADHKRIKKLRLHQQRKSKIARLFAVIFAVGTGWLIIITMTFIAFSPEYNSFYILFILSLPSIFGLLVSCGLWGWKRWCAITGWTLASAGGITFIMGASVTLLSKTTMWQQSMAELGNEVDSALFQTMWQIGLIPTVLGVVFLFLQHNRDVDLSSNLAKNAIPTAVNESKVGNRIET